MLALEPGAQRLALDIGTDEVARLAGRAGVVERKYVRMLEAGEESNLALESFGTGCIANVRTKDLDGDRPVVADVASKEHDSHATAAELPLDHVPVSEQLLKPLGQDAHRTLRLRRWQYALLTAKRKGRRRGTDNGRWG